MIKKTFTLVELIASIVILTIVIFGTTIFIQEMLGSVSSPQLLIAQSNAFRSTCHKIRNDHNVNFRADLATFKDKVGAEFSSQNNSYGEYQVIENRYVSFTQGTNTYTETDSTVVTNYLKVKISNKQGGESSLLLFHGELIP